MTGPCPTMLLHLCDSSGRLEYHDKEVMTIDEYGDGRAWSLISNQGHALVCLAQQPDVRLWELAETIGIRERSAQRIVNQLVDAGYVTRHQHDHHRARTATPSTASCIYAARTWRVHRRRPH